MAMLLFIRWWGLKETTVMCSPQADQDKDMVQCVALALVRCVTLALAYFLKSLDTVQSCTPSTQVAAAYRTLRSFQSTWTRGRSPLGFFVSPHLSFTRAQTKFANHVHALTYPLESGVVICILQYIDDHCVHFFGPIWAKTAKNRLKLGDTRFFAHFLMCALIIFFRVSAHGPKGVFLIPN